LEAKNLVMEGFSREREAAPRKGKAVDRAAHEIPQGTARVASETAAEWPLCPFLGVRP